MCVKGRFRGHIHRVHCSGQKTCYTVARTSLSCLHISRGAHTACADMCMERSRIASNRHVVPTIRNVLSLSKLMVVGWADGRGKSGSPCPRKLVGGGAMGMCFKIFRLGWIFVV